MDHLEAVVEVDKKFDPFEHENLFYQYRVKITNDEINQILLLLKNKNLTYTEQPTTYKYLNILNFPLLKNLRKQVISILNNHGLLLENNWAQLYNKNNYHSLHNHYQSIYSGIIYLSGKNCSPTVFYGGFKLKKYLHDFKKNTLLMFPSMIPHEVQSLKKNEERLIISFNTHEKYK
jgi:hypothetical protein